MGKGGEKVLCSVPGCEEKVLARRLCSTHYNAERYKSICSGTWSPRKKGTRPVLDSEEAFAVEVILKFRKAQKIWASGEELIHSVQKSKRKMLVHGIWKLFERGVIRYGLYPSNGMNRLTLAGMFEGKEVPKKVVPPMIRLSVTDEKTRQEEGREGKEGGSDGRRGSVVRFPRRPGGHVHRRGGYRDPDDAFREEFAARSSSDFEVPYGDAIEDFPEIGDR